MEQLGVETDFDFILELIDSYKPMLETKLDELTSAYSSKDLKKFRFTAHSLKGAALNIGANDYAAVCKEIEDQTLDGELKGLESLLEELAKAQAELLRMLLVVKEKLRSKS